MLLLPTRGIDNTYVSLFTILYSVMGAADERCKELANLASQSVDYAKSGKPAIFSILDLSACLFKHYSNGMLR